MSETTQPTPFLLERPYYQDQTRAEVYRQRMQLWAADPQTLAQAGQREEAAMAAALKEDPNAAPEHWVECYEADEQMDLACEDLLGRRFQKASVRLPRVIGSYRKGGISRSWDLADALHLSGLAAWQQGKRQAAVALLVQAMHLERAQARTRAWLRASIALLAVRVGGGMTPPDPTVLSGLVRSCQEHGCRLEVLWLRLLVVQGLLRVGDLGEARRQLIGMRAQAAEAGQQGIAMVQGVLRQATVRHSLRLVLNDLTGRHLKTVGEARRFLLDWQIARPTPRQVLRVIRATQLLREISPGDGKLRERERKLRGFLSAMLPPLSSQPRSAGNAR